MKKMIFAALALASVMAVTGCSNSAGSIVSGNGSVVQDSSQVSGESSSAETETPDDDEEDEGPSETSKGSGEESSQTSDNSGSDEESSQTSRDKDEVDTEALFGGLTEQFVRSGAHWGARLHIRSDGSFDYDYSARTKAPANGKLGIATASQFTGRFTDVKRVNDYTYSMTISDMEFTVEPGTKEEKNDCEVTYTNDTYGLAEGATVKLYTPDAPIQSLPSQFTNYARVPNGIPNGDKLGAYCIQDTDGKPYYSTNR